LEDKKIYKIKRNSKEEKTPKFTKTNQGVLWYKRRICMPNIKELKDKIFRKSHKSTYSIHLGENKMYPNLKETYGWYGIKRNVVEYVALF
jgi:hypothetical protein